MKIQKWVLEAAVLLLAAGWLCLSKPTDKRPILLPPSLTPEHYEISISPEISRGVFRGVVVIGGVAVTETTRIVLHCSHLVFNTTTLVDITVNEEVEVRNLEEDKFLQQCHLFLNQSLKVDHEYKLTIEFMGFIGKDGVGLYSYFYRAGGTRHDILMTHFQPNYARAMIPCWDEPHYKAQFFVRVARSHFPTVISNMPVSSLSTTDPGDESGGWVEFEETPPMSTYLLVIVWCDYLALTDSVANNSVWAPRDRLHEAQLALNVSVAVVEQCERYFGTEYPLPKLDHIPLPSLNNVAMENWGAITYKKEFLLWEEGVSTWAQKELTAYVVCHEIIHQWLGNLVTTAWWNTTWLNEGVTSFYHYLFLDKIEPTWKVMDNVFVTQIQMILNEEATRSPKPLTNNEPVSQDAIANSAFSATTYLKGAAIIRMVYNLMAPDVFREAIVQYIFDNQYGSVDEEDLWQNIAAVADLSVDLEAVMYSWTHQPGFPLVTVLRSPDGCISVRQEKYLGTDESDMQWTIPLTYTTSDEADFYLPHMVWLPEDVDSMKLEECLDPGDWIIVNIRQSGFYRVNYDSQTWRALTHDLLHCDLSDIHTVNRAQLLDDGFDLARHGLLEYSVILELSRYLIRETEPLPWAVAIQWLNAIRLQLYKTDVFPYFQRYARNLVEVMLSKISMSGDLGDLLPEGHRKQIVEFACGLDHPQCVKEATVTAYLLMSGVNINVPLDLTPTLLCTAVRYGQEEVWHFVLKQYLSASENERWNYLGALACSSKMEVVDRLLKDFISPSFIHNDDRINLLLEMGKQDDNLDPILDMILSKFHLLHANFEFEIILDLLKSFLKPYMNLQQKQKIERLADMINNRQIPKELDLMETILQEMNREDFMSLKDDSVRSWFIKEVNDDRKHTVLITPTPPSLRNNDQTTVENTNDHDDQDIDEDNEDESEEFVATGLPKVPSSNSAGYEGSSLLLTTVIIIYICVIR